MAIDKDEMLKQLQEMAQNAKATYVLRGSSLTDGGVKNM